MPKQYDGDTVDFELKTINTSANSGNLVYNVDCVCSELFDPFNDVYGASKPISITYGPDTNIEKRGVAERVTCGGVCRGSATIYWRARLDLILTTLADPGDIAILNMKLRYDRTGVDEDILATPIPEKSPPPFVR